MSKIPARYMTEFRAKQTQLVRGRVGLLAFTAMNICFAISFQYALRKYFLNEDSFRPKELILWLVFFSAGTVIILLNNRSKSLVRSKTLGYVFHSLLVFALATLGVIYADNALLFPFYFAFALLLTCVTVPWKTLDIVVLSSISIGTFAAFHSYVTYGLHKTIPSFNRFHAFWDGLLFIGIGFVMGLVIRRNENEREIENFILLEQVEEKNRQIEEELSLARHIHETLIPAPLSSENVDISVQYVPVRHVGGDYARFLFLSDGRLMFFISDVTGHGMAAALLVNRLHAEFDRLSREHQEPAALMHELNDFIACDFSRQNMYLTAFCGVLDFDKRTLIYCNHGHPSQYLVRRETNVVEPLTAQSGLLGLWPDETPSHQNSLRFEDGDEIVLFTDGVTEAHQDSEDLFGERRLMDFISPRRSADRRMLSAGIIEALKDFTGNQFKDDIFVVHIRIKRHKAALQPAPAFSNTGGP